MKSLEDSLKANAFENDRIKEDSKITQALIVNEVVMQESKTHLIC